jgi:hypothetical protein
MTRAHFASLAKRVRDPRSRGVIIGVCGAMIGVAAYSSSPAPATAGGASYNITANSPSPSTDDTSDNTTLATWLDSQKPTTARNPFSIRLDAFPAAGNGVDLGKSVDGPADQKKQRPQVQSDLQRAAAALRLQSVAMGMTPTAVINGVSAKEGDVVASFRIARIEWNGVVVEKDGVEFDIALDETNSRRVE